MGPPASASLGFGFNQATFSDRVLCLEMRPDLASGKEKWVNWFSSLDVNHSECGGDLQVKKLHINSLVLASRSPFFFKLFTNGMKESDKKEDVTIRINAFEEAALMDLLNFMYGNTMSATAVPELVGVMMAADKFEVNSCIIHCVELLLKVPMSVEYVLLYLELPSPVMEGEIVQPLIHKAKQYLVTLYRDFTVSKRKEAMALPLCAILVVLGSNGLRVDSEDVVYDFTLKWARLHYPKAEERREILTKHLVQFICFSNMGSLKLKKVLDCSDFDYDQMVNRVLNALFSKVEDTPECGYPTRVYRIMPIKVVNYEFRPPHCVVFLNIKKQDCHDLFPSKKLYSQPFCLGGKEFVLIVLCGLKDLVHKFGVFLEMKGLESCTLEWDFAVLKEASMEFEVQSERSSTSFTSIDKAWGLWPFEWTELMSDQSVYFIDGILHLRAQITLND